MGGMGKTTIARAVYDYICRQFEGCTFIENVREVTNKSGLKTLQEQLISETLMEKDLKLGSIDIGISMIKNRVCRKKVLIVLDDVDESTKLEKLVGKHQWFNFGSRIIITTRDQHLLTTYGVRDVYRVKELNINEAEKLFISKAFGKYQLVRGYRDLLVHVLEYCKGLPLALKVLGSLLCGRKKDEWKSVLNKLKENMDNTVQQVLRISYDALDLKEKEIFLDIACFFKGKDKNDVTKILDSCGFHPNIGINVLVEKSFITISHNKLWMHDLIQNLGWDIVFQESPKKPEERSRLWLHEDIKDVLMGNMETKTVEGIVVDYVDPGQGENSKDFWLKQLRLRPKAFAKMTSLRILKFCSMHLSEDFEYLSNKLRYLEWCGYHLKYMPSTFQPEHLVELHLTYSRIEQLWKGKMLLNKLRIVNLSHSIYLIKSPDFTGVPNLERLILEGCTHLVTLDPSIGLLRRLICLNLKNCKNLKSLPSGIQLESLDILILSGCSKLKNFSESFRYMKCLSELYLDGTSIRELPQSIENLSNLGLMNLKDCQNLGSISNICQLKSLKTLILSGCSKLDKLPEDVGVLASLKELHADRTAIRQPPSSIVLLKNLEMLSFQACKTTKSNSWSSLFLSLFLPRQRVNSMTFVLPDLSGLDSLTGLDLSDCNLKSIPAAICSLYSLRCLDLSGNDFESLPDRMNGLCKLEDFNLSGCKRLQEVPELPSDIRCLLAIDCESLTTILSPSIYRSIFCFTFTNCFKLLEKKQNILTEILLANQQFQGNLSHRYKGQRCYAFPGSEIPKCFTHRSMGSSLSFHLPPHWYNSSFLGFSFCAVGGISGLFFKMRIGKRYKHYSGRALSLEMKCEHVKVYNVSREYVDLEREFEVDELNEGGMELEACIFSIPRQKIEDRKDPEDWTMEDIPEIKYCGARLLYKEDDEGICSGSGVVDGGSTTDISVEEIDDATATATTTTTSKRRRNDYKAAGLCGSGGVDEKNSYRKRFKTFR